MAKGSTKGVLVALLVAVAWPLCGQESCGVALKNSDKTKYNAAISAYESGHYVESAEQLRKLSAKNPKCADIYFYLGMTAVNRDFNAAGIRRYFGKLLTLCPDYPNALAHYYHGIINYSDEHYEEAVMDFNRFFEMANVAREVAYDAVYAEASNYLHWSEFLAEANRNKVPFVPQVVKGVSSPSDELLPYLTVDGRYMYYLRTISLNTEKTFYAKEFDTRVPRLFVSNRQDSLFSMGSELLPPFNQHDSEGGITMTADNRTLYYSVMTRGKGGYNNCDIYYTTLHDGSWTAIQNAGPLVNGETSWESQPTITPDGQYLYFASNRSGGMGGIDIWRCHRLPDGGWSRAENLGPSVNTAGNEKCPFIHADGKTLYFASNGWQGFGGYDMYFIDVCNIHSQRPTNMGLPINTADNDICFGVTADGLQGYFSGKSPEWKGIGGRDIFSFDLYPSARPEGMRVAHGTMTTANGTPLTGAVRVIRYGADDAVYLPNASDGTFAVALSRHEDMVLVAHAEGYMPAVQWVPAGKVRRGAAVELDFVLKAADKGSKHALPTMLYDAKRKQITDEGKKMLNAYVAYLQEHPLLHIAVEAPAADMAKAVYDYMLSQRLRAERLSHRSGTDVRCLQLTVKQ